MTDKKSNMRREFSRAHDNTPKPKKQAAEVPKISQQNQPIPRPRPPGIGHEVDTQHFNERWQKDVEAFQNHNRKAAQINNLKVTDFHRKAGVIKRSGLKLSEKFAQIERRAKERSKDRERDR